MRRRLLRVILKLVLGLHLRAYLMSRRASQRIAAHLHVRDPSVPFASVVSREGPDGLEGLQEADQSGEVVLWVVELREVAAVGAVEIGALG